VIDLHLEGIARRVPFAGPRTVHVDVTNACNTNCVTCWDHSPLLSSPRARAWKKQRVERDEVERLIDDVIGLGGLDAVIVSGMGEPFTHPQIYEILALLKARGLHVTVITNLVLVDPARIAALVDQLLIGIHGATKASYQAFHPSFTGDQWERLHRILGRLRGRRDKHVHVISGCNAHEIFEMIDLGVRYDAAQINFKLASLGHGTETARISEAQRSWLVAELPRARAHAEASGIATNLDVFEAQLRAGGADTAPIDEIGCFMGYVYARVLVDGTVLYCCNTEVVVGNLREASFSELWRGPGWQALRDRMHRGDYLPSCRQCGKVVQNVGWARRFEKRHGLAALRAATGGDRPRRRHLPLVRA
jgi:MoaA/NifB/PqqE/SkfB family radical SAM enzyme